MKKHPTGLAVTLVAVSGLAVLVALMAVTHGRQEASKEAVSSQFDERYEDVAQRGAESGKGAIKALDNSAVDWQSRRLRQPINFSL